MNNIIGELFPKIMGGCCKLALPPQRQQPYSDELFSQSPNASVFSKSIKKPDRVGMPNMSAPMSAPSQAIQTGTVVDDWVADRNAYQSAGLPNIQALYSDKL